MGHDLRPPTFPKLPILLHRILGQSLVQIDLKTDKDLCWSKSQREKERERERELPTRLTSFLKWPTLIMNIQMMLSNTHEHTTFFLVFSCFLLSFQVSPFFPIILITFMALSTTPPFSPYKIFSFFSVLPLLMLPSAFLHFHLPFFFFFIFVSPSSLSSSSILLCFSLSSSSSTQLHCPTLLFSGQYRSQPSLCHIT